MQTLTSWVARVGGLALVVGSSAVLLAADLTTHTNRFGFTGPEIFPIDPMISLLHAADFNGDGRLDLLVVNNLRSKINLLYNQTGQTNTAAARPIKRELNELPPDARFRIESIASEKRISSLVVADLNGDHRPDLAYFGDPKELVVLYNQGTNGWSRPKRWPMDDGQFDVNALAAGDLNGDGRQDLVLLGENALHFFAQRADHTLAEPVRIPYTGSVKAVQILDLNGDGRDDLLLVNWESENPFRCRLQNAQGQLGPEMRFAMSPIRSYAADDLDADRQTEIITIAQKSGRAQIWHFVRQPAAPLAGSFHEGQLALLPLPKTSQNRRGLVWADVNGDGLADLLVAEPDSGQLTLYLQRADGSFESARTYPTLTGISTVAVADWNHDGVPDIFVLSSDERQVGVTHFDAKGRIAFPTMVPLEGRPIALAVGRLRPNENPVLAVIIDQGGKRSLVIRAADGTTTRQKLSDSFKGNPSAMLFHDADQDGLPDLVVLVPYEKIKVLLQQPDRTFTEHDIAPPGGSLEQPWVTTADVDGDGKPELLLAQRNFLRAVVVRPEPRIPDSTNQPAWTFKVKDQINGISSSSRIVAAAAVPNGTANIPGLFLLDAGRKVLTLCERDATGVWQVRRSVPLPVTDYTAAIPLGLGQATPNAVAFSGLNGVAWLRLSGQVWNLEEMDSYETPIRNGYLRDVVTGDLNNDGRKDLVFLETAQHYLDIVTFEPPHQLVPANRWPVFEERTFRSRRTEVPEPREALIGDFTGDGRNDLVVLVHDRILLYPQE